MGVYVSLFYKCDVCPCMCPYMCPYMGNRLTMDICRRGWSRTRCSRPRHRCDVCPYMCPYMCPYSIGGMYALICVLISGRGAVGPAAMV